MLPESVLGPRAVAVVWDVHARRRLLSLFGHAHHIGTLAWHPSGNELATGSWDKTVIVWDTKDGSRRAAFERFPEIIQAVAWNADGTFLAIAAGSFENATWIWSLEAAQNE
jgi:WD40 repeat protein